MYTSNNINRILLVRVKVRVRRTKTADVRNRRRQTAGQRAETGDVRRRKKGGRQAMHRRAFRLLAVNTAMWAATAFFGPFIGAFYAQEGIDSFSIGILTAIGPLASIFIQPLWAWLSDRTGRRRRILIVISAGSGFSALFYLIGKPFYLAATLLFYCFSTALLPCSDALVTGETRRYSLNFAHIRLGGTLGFALVSATIGGVLAGNRARMFPLCCAAYLAFALVCFLLPRDEICGGASKPDRPAKIRPRADRTDRRIFKSGQVVFVLVFALIIQFGMSFHSAFLGVYTVRLGYGSATLGMLSCLSALSEVPILLLASRLTRRYSALTLLIFSACMMVVRLLLVAGESLAFIVLSQLMQGVTYMTTYYSCVTFISENVLEGKTSRGQSVLAIVQAGIGSVGGAAGGGLLTGMIGLRASYLVMAALLLSVCAANVVVCRAFLKKKPAGGGSQSPVR